MLQAGKHSREIVRTERDAVASTLQQAAAHAQLATRCSQQPCSPSRLQPPTIQHALLELLDVVLGHALREGQNERHQLRHAHLQRNHVRGAGGSVSAACSQ